LPLALPGNAIELLCSARLEVGKNRMPPALIQYCRQFCHEFSREWVKPGKSLIFQLLAAWCPGRDRDGLIDAPKPDWIEWQAGWVSGGILMPATELRAWAAELAARVNAKLPFGDISREGGKLIYLVAKRCDVSQLAAKIRLIKLGLHVENSSNRRRLRS
jgi:hypothetical protein